MIAASASGMPFRIKSPASNGAYAAMLAAAHAPDSGQICQQAAGLFFDSQFVVDLLDALNRADDFDRLVHLLLVVHETAQLHFAFFGFDLDIGAFNIGRRRQRRLHLGGDHAVIDRGTDGRSSAAA